jgi:hypothetical protein
VRDRIRPLRLGGAGTLADGAVRAAEAPGDASPRRSSGDVMGPRAGTPSRVDPINVPVHSTCSASARLVFSTFAETRVR